MGAAPTAEDSPRARVILLRPNNLNIPLATVLPRDLSLRLLAMAIPRAVNLLITFTEKAQVYRDILLDIDLEGAAVNITLVSGTSQDRGQRLVTTKGHSRMEDSHLQMSNLNNNRGSRDTGSKGSNSTNNINNRSCSNNSSSNSMEPCRGIPPGMGGGAPPIPLCPRPTLVLANKCQANTHRPLPRSISPSPCRGQYSTSHLRRQPGQRSRHQRWVPSPIPRCHSTSRCCPRPLTTPSQDSTRQPRPPTPPPVRCRPSPCPLTLNPVSRHSSRLSQSPRSGTTLPRYLSTLDTSHQWIRAR